MEIDLDYVTPETVEAIIRDQSEKLAELTGLENGYLKTIDLLDNRLVELNRISSEQHQRIIELEGRDRCPPYSVAAVQSEAKKELALELIAFTSKMSTEQAIAVLDGLSDAGYRNLAVKEWRRRTGLDLVCAANALDSVVL